MSEALESTPIESTEVSTPEGEVSSEAELQTASEETAPVESETQEDFEQEVQQAIDEGASQEEIVNMVKKFQLKVNGKTIEKELDLSDEKTVQRELQMAAAGRQAMQDIASLKKEYEAQLRRLQENPWEVLEEFDLDPDELAEQRIRQKVENLKKTPEQLEQERINKELTEAREKLRRYEQEQEAKRQAEEDAKLAQEIENEIIEALDAHQTLPKSAKTVSRITDALVWAMDWAEEQGLPQDSVSVNDVISVVEEEMREEIRELMDNADEMMLEEYIGKKNLDRLKAKNKEKIQEKIVEVPNANVSSTTNSVTKAEKKPAEKKKASDYFRELGRKYSKN